MPVLAGVQALVIEHFTHFVEVKLAKDTFASNVNLLKVVSTGICVCC